LGKCSSTLRVSRPIEVVVLNCCATETNDMLCWSNSSTSLAKSANERVSMLDGRVHITSDLPADAFAVIDDRPGMREGRAARPAPRQGS
jgi:hypothetical protein